MTRVYEDFMLRELRFVPGNIYGGDIIPTGRLAEQADYGLNAFNVPLPFSTHDNHSQLRTALENISAPGGYLDQLEASNVLQFATRMANTTGGPVCLLQDTQ